MRRSFVGPSPRSGARRSGPIGLAAAFVAGVAILAGLAGPTLAQSHHALTLAPPPGPRPPAPAADDGLAGGGFYLEADTLAQNDTTHHVVATGAVEARYKGRVLRAQSVDYDRDTGRVVARGAVQVLEPDGTAQFADSLTLDKSLSEGFATGFSTRLQDHVLIAAATTQKTSDQVTRLDHVIYTPCEVCLRPGQSRPTWSIRARSVIENKAKKTLYFKGAVIQVLGVGVLYLPILQTADPTADRKSGFLLPVLTLAGPRGISYEQPYYKVISTSQDITITPQINSLVYPFLNIDWRKRFYSGVVDIRAGYAYDQDFTSGGDKFGPYTSHSYVLGAGLFQLSPKWQWGFTAEHTSDKLIFDKYSIGDVFVDRGLYAADDRRLISQIYAVRQDQLSYLSIAAIDVQGLRSTDIQSTFPTIAPLIEGHYEPAAEILGGRLRINGGAVVLTREQSLADDVSVGEPLLPGIDSRRATLQVDWRRDFTFANGLRVSPFVTGRGDVYNVTNFPTSSSSDTFARAFGAIGADIRYPLIKQTPNATFIVEPTAQIAISPNTKLDPRIPDEDSAVWEFDETNLFDVNRSPGFDLYQGGQSVTLGGRATVLLPDGRTGSFVFGRRFATGRDSAVPDRTGLADALSDYVFAADATPIKGIRLFTRLRMDSSTFKVNRLEAGATFDTARADGYVSYLEEAQAPTGGKVRSLDIHGELFATRHWGVSAYAIVENGAWRRRDLGVVYRDDCVRLEVLYRHDETFDSPTFGPTSSVVLRLTLATLGNKR